MPGDKFVMRSTNGFILFTAYGLSDLENTLKGILPRGYRVRKKQTLSRRLKQWGGLELYSIFRILMIEVKEVDFKPPIEHQVPYFNKSREREFELKTIDPKYWDESPNN